MLTHQHSGFRAALAVRELPSPPISPAAGQGGGLPPQPTHAASSVEPSPVSKLLVEHVPAELESGQVVTYVLASDEPCRVLFHRDRSLKPVEGLEAYAAFLYLPDEQPWCKVFATGGAVLDLPGLDWYIDGELGPPASSLAETATHCAELKIFRCRLKQDAQLGYGYVNSSDVAAVDESAPVCVFAWHFVTKRQLELLTVGPSRVTAHTTSPLGIKIASADEREETLQHELTPALEFLRLSNRLLVSLLTADQKSKFIHLLLTSQEAQQLLQVDELRALGQFGKETAQPDGDTSTISEQASDRSSLVTPDLHSAQGETSTGKRRQAAPGTVNRLRRRKTAPARYREPSSE